MPFTFNPSMFSRFSGRIDAIGQLSHDVAVEAAQAFADTAEPIMRQAFIDAETGTGQARAARGGNGPGRVDTERLINSIKKAIEDGGSEVTGRAGFLDANEDEDFYFLLQDQGFQRVSGAHALEAGFVAGREAAIAVIVRRWGN